jgi:hypothetical protein
MAAFGSTLSVHSREESTMWITMWLFAALALGCLPSAVQAQLHPWGGGSPIYSPNPPGRPSGARVLPEPYDPWGGSRARFGPSIPGRPGRNLGPANPWERFGDRGQENGLGGLPGSHLPGQPQLPGIDHLPPDPGLNPGPSGRDRDQPAGPGLSAIPHVPHIPHLPEFREPAFKPAPVGEVTTGLRETGWGRGWLVGLGGAIAGLFRALFGRKREGGSG